MSLLRHATTVCFDCGRAIRPARFAAHRCEGYTAFPTASFRLKPWPISTKGHGAYKKQIRLKAVAARYSAFPVDGIA